MSHHRPFPNLVHQLETLPIGEYMIWEREERLGMEICEFVELLNLVVELLDSPHSWRSYMIQSSTNSGKVSVHVSHRIDAKSISDFFQQQMDAAIAEGLLNLRP